MEISNEKIRAFLSSPDANERRQAVVIAVKLNRSDLVPEITEIAGSDADQELRVLARKALERLAKKKPADNKSYDSTHFEQLLQAEDPYARFAGLKKALQQNNDVARLSILSALDRETVPQLKASMLMALGRFKNPDDVDVLSEYLKDSDSRVRANTVEALSTIGGDKASRYIVTMMADEDNRVKTNVLKTLKELGGPNLLNLLQEMARDDRAWIRASAVYAFSKIKSPQSLVALAQIASQDNVEEIRTRALEILQKEQKAGNPAAAKILQKLAALQQDRSKKPLDDTRIKETQKEIASQFVAPEGESLAQQILSQDPCQRYLAISAIQKQFEENRQIFVKAFVDENDSFLISMMLTIIKEHKVSEVINRCIQLLKHDDDRVRANAIEAAAEIEVASSAEYIVPLLKDKNSRVAANAVIALGSIGRVDLFEEVQRLLAYGRERFRQSALYIISLHREQQFLPILKKLLTDSSPKVRDKAYDLLRVYANDNVLGAAKILQGVEKRISLEQNREHFFENHLDKMFSSLVHLIKTNDENQDQLGFEKTPEAEQQALVALAQKSIELNLSDEKTLAMLEKIDAELTNIEKMLQEVSANPSDGNLVKESAEKMSEIQLLNIEKRSLTARRNALLAAFAMDIYTSRQMLDLHSQAALRVELARAEGCMCSHVPKGTFSMLPDDDAPVSEIFDVAMRLYQKHVWTFSIKTLSFSIRSGIYGGFFAIFMMIFLRLHAFVGGIFILIMGPYIAYKCFGLFVEWKTLIGCMVDDLIHGKSVSSKNWNSRVEEMYPKVMSNTLRKFLFLFLYFIVSLIIGSVVIGGSQVFLQDTIFEHLAKLIGLLMIIFIMGSVYFKYNLIEPISIFFDDDDAFNIANKLYAKGRVKIITLIVFSTFIMTLITGYSLQAAQLALPLLPATMGLPLVLLLAFLSEICLLPIAYSCVVIYTLMYKEKRKITNRPA